MTCSAFVWVSTQPRIEHFGSSNVELNRRLPCPSGGNNVRLVQTNEDAREIVDLGRQVVERVDVEGENATRLTVAEVGPNARVPKFSVVSRYGICRPRQQCPSDSSTEDKGLIQRLDGKPRVPVRLRQRDVRRLHQMPRQELPVKKGMHRSIDSLGHRNQRQIRDSRGFLVLEGNRIGFKLLRKIEIGALLPIMQSIGNDTDNLVRFLPAVVAGLVGGQDDRKIDPVSSREKAFWRAVIPIHVRVRKRLATQVAKGRLTVQPQLLLGGNLDGLH